MSRIFLCAALLLTVLTSSAQRTTADASNSPAQADPNPLPYVEDLLKAVEAHEDRDDALLQQYTYHSHWVMEEFDRDEDVKKTKSVDSESIPIGGVRVRRVVARDGKPLSPDEAKKEDEEFDKKVQSAKENKAKFDAKVEQAKREGKSNNAFLPASRILQLGTFSNERRVDFNGRPTIVLDYAGKHDIKTSNASEKIVEDLVGTVWIDEQDKVLARVEGHFLADFKLAFGLLLDIHKGLSFTMEQQKINGEVWLTKEIDGRGKASLGVFVERVHGHTHAEMSDYRKFRTSSTIIPSNRVIGPDGQPIPEPPSTPQPQPQP